MTDRQRKILDTLTGAGKFGMSAYALHFATWAPMPSIRRDIGALRRRGWDILTLKPSGYRHARYVLSSSR